MNSIIYRSLLLFGIGGLVVSTASLMAAPSQTSESSVAEVKLTGITQFSGKKKALLLVRETAQNGQSRSPILSEGESEGAIEVLQIDEVRGRVRVRNGSKEMELSFSRDGIPVSAPPAIINTSAPPSTALTLALPQPAATPPADTENPAPSSGNRVFVFGGSSRRASSFPKNDNLIVSANTLSPSSLWVPPFQDNGRSDANSTPPPLLTTMPDLVPHENPGPLKQMAPLIPTSIYPLPPPSSPPVQRSSGGDSLQRSGGTGGAQMARP